MKPVVTREALLSTTVVANTALEADALSTGLFCLDLEESKRVLAELKNTRLMTITDDNQAMSVHDFPD